MLVVVVCTDPVPSSLQIHFTQCSSFHCKPKTAKRNAKVFFFYFRSTKKKLVLSSHSELTIRALVSQNN